MCVGYIDMVISVTVYLRHHPSATSHLLTRATLVEILKISN